ncbi:MAG TPA: sterol desaturase family protein [Burkholderiales bacterium]|jgi:sterol desaturase/sphingolipid hydroxylase (fatty acid hydroxylase superfamily)|nr:sterol desaturase family protein [Burkholderiales bacterium]
MLVKAAVIFAFGPTAQAVMIFEVVLDGAAVFNHANASLPAGPDRILRWLIVTPDMHRVHHSKDPRETNGNYGFNRSVWDRLFGSNRAQPRLGHRAMQIGVNGLENPRRSLKLHGLLMIPFLPVTDNAVTHRDRHEGAIHP